MPSHEPQWSQSEEQITRTALEKAYSRETKALVTEIREKASQITEITDVWSLHDYLSTQRYDIDGKYDSRDATPLFVLAKLYKQGWLKSEDLVGLTADKKAKIIALSRMQ